MYGEFFVISSSDPIFLDNTSINTRQLRHPDPGVTRLHQLTSSLPSNSPFNFSTSDRDLRPSSAYIEYPNQRDQHLLLSAHGPDTLSWLSVFPLANCRSMPMPSCNHFRLVFKQPPYRLCLVRQPSIQPVSGPRLSIVV